jgi:ABC-type lipoprotein release transport system permease subunit
MEPWIERQKNILDFTLSSLLRRKGKNLALIFVYAFIVFMLGSVLFFTHALKREASIILQEAPEMIVQRTSAGRHNPIPVQYMESIRKIRGVQSVRGRLWGYYYDPVTGANYTVMVSENFKLEPDKIAIGQGISRTRLVFPGDSMEFRSQDGTLLSLQVDRIFPAASELVSSDLILLSEEDFFRLFGGSKELATDLALGVRNPKELSTIALKIAEMFPDTRIILREEILRTYDSIFDWRGGMMIFILAGALFAFIILAWDRASGLSQEEKREIGILKAIGWETSDVLLLKFWEGLVISLSAFLAGIIFAYGHVFFAKSLFFEPVLKGWSVLYPDFRLTPFIDPAQIATLLFLTVVPYTVATIVPSWRAATIDPDSVMRT